MRRLRARAQWSACNVCSLDNPGFRLGTYWLDVDSALALALGLTCFVSRSHLPDHTLCRLGRPSDSLEQLILAWMRGDSQKFDSELAANAAASFVLRWLPIVDHIPRKAGAERLRRDDAVGIAGRGRWLLLRTFETLSSMRALLSATDFVHPDLDVEFANRWGKGWSFRVRFLGMAPGGGVNGPGHDSGLFIPRTYHVDNADIEGLIKTISSCASDDSR